MQAEGWASFAYGYDVRSDESGQQGHRHLPSEVLQLYRYIRTFYHASQGNLAGVILVGDFPSAGTCGLTDAPFGNGLPRQDELDYFGVDVMLADPFGYWEWLAIAPMVPPGSVTTLQLPFDQNRHWAVTLRTFSTGPSS